MNNTLGKIGSLEVHDHNGKLELIPTGELDYSMLTYPEAAQLVSLIVEFLAQRIINLMDEG